MSDLTSLEHSELERKLRQAENKFQAIDIKKDFYGKVYLKEWETVRKKLEGLGVKVEEYQINSYHLSYRGNRVSFFPRSRKAQVHKGGKWIGPIGRFLWTETLMKLLKGEKV